MGTWDNEVKLLKPSWRFKFRDDSETSQQWFYTESDILLGKIGFWVATILKLFLTARGIWMELKIAYQNTEQIS